MISRRGLAQKVLAAFLLVFPVSVYADADKSGAGLGAGASVDGSRPIDGSRIVSVGGSVTEIIYALEMQDRIVAVDSTSQYPASALSRPNVGYMRQLSAEPILALTPSVVLAIEDSGPDTTLAQLREAGVRVVTIPDDPTPGGAVAKIKYVANALGVPDAGRALAEKLRAGLERVKTALGDVKTRPRVLFLLSLGNGRAPFAAGANTSAAGIIALSGGENAISGYEGYKPLSPEAVVASAPDVILVTERTFEMLGGASGIAALPEIMETPAGKAGRIVAMNGLLLLGFGPRTGAAARDLAQSLHPKMRFVADAQ